MTAFPRGPTLWRVTGRSGCQKTEVSSAQLSVAPSSQPIRKWVSADATVSNLRPGEPPAVSKDVEMRRRQTQSNIKMLYRLCSQLLLRYIRITLLHTRMDSKMLMMHHYIFVGNFFSSFGLNYTHTYTYYIYIYNIYLNIYTCINTQKYTHKCVYVHMYLFIYI